jgi:hypothetical protein
MQPKKLVALFGATVAVVLVPAAPTIAAGVKKVTVRIEGRSKTLLASTVVPTHSGWITKGGAPRGACPATSAAGALDVATHHKWSAKFEKSFNDYFIKTILGDTESGKKSYWGIWVDNRYATTGACEIKLRRGDQLLFAVDSVAHHEHPIAIRAPSHATVGHSFTVKIVWFSDSGVASPLKGARLTVAGKTAVTKARGIVQVKVSNPGKFVLRAERKGYVRPAPVTVRVTG